MQLIVGSEIQWGLLYNDNGINIYPTGKIITKETFHIPYVFITMCIYIITILPLLDQCSYYFHFKKEDIKKRSLEFGSSDYVTLGSEYKYSQQGFLTEDMPQESAKHTRRYMSGESMWRGEKESSWTGTKEALSKQARPGLSLQPILGHQVPSGDILYMKKALYKELGKYTENTMNKKLLCSSPKKTPWNLCWHLSLLFLGGKRLERVYTGIVVFIS